MSNWKNDGQVLVEWILALSMTLPLFIGLSKIIWNQFQHLRCARAVFETAHRELVGRPPHLAWLLRYQIHVDELNGKVRARGRCIEAKDEVRLEAL